MNIHGMVSSLVTEAQRLQRSTKLIQTFRFIEQYDHPGNMTRKLKKRTVGLNVAQTTIVLVFTLQHSMDTVACQVKDRFHDDMLGIFEEMGNFKPSKLITEDNVPTDKKVS